MGKEWCLPLPLVGAIGKGDFGLPSNFHWPIGFVFIVLNKQCEGIVSFIILY